MLAVGCGDDVIVGAGVELLVTGVGVGVGVDETWARGLSVGETVGDALGVGRLTSANGLSVGEGAGVVVLTGVAKVRENP